MSEVLISAPDGEAIPLHAVGKPGLESFLARRPAAAKAQLEAQSFKAALGQACVVARGDGRTWFAVVGLGGGERPDPMALRAASAKLPPGDYRLGSIRGVSPLQAAIAW